MVTISGSTNKIISEPCNYTTPGCGAPYYLQLDVSNNLLYSFDVFTNGIDVFNASANGAYVKTILSNGGSSIGGYGLMPADYALDGNLVSGMFYAGGCYAEYGVLNGGGCILYDYASTCCLNGTYYSITGTKIGSKIPSFSGTTDLGCISPFWSGVSKLTYVECNSKLFVFTTSTGKLQTTLNVQGTIMVFNRLSNLLWIQLGAAVYEIGT
jgi:hypothetical protein